MTITERYGHTLDVPCPRCLAEPGALCVTWPAQWGDVCGIARKPHAARWRRLHKDVLSPEELEPA